MTLKKLFSLSLFLFLLLMVCSAGKVELEDLKYSFVLPDSYLTERKNTSSGYQYFTARHPQDTIVMTVTSASYSGKSFDSMSGSEIQKLEESMQAQVRAYGFTVVGCVSYTSNGIKFLKYEIKPPKGYQIQYSAVKDRRLVNFTFTFRSTPTSSERDEVLKIVKSIRNI